MKYLKLLKLSNNIYKRKVGITKDLFKRIVKIVKKVDTERQTRGGRKRRLPIEELIVMSFEYWREYRTLENISLDYGLCITQVYRTILWIEDILIKNSLFRLPGKKQLLKESKNPIIVDVTETPIRRKKKTQKNIILEKRK